MILKGFKGIMKDFYKDSKLEQKARAEMLRFAKAIRIRHLYGNSKVCHNKKKTLQNLGEALTAPERSEEAWGGLGNSGQVRGGPGRSWEVRGGPEPLDHPKT